MPSLKSVKRRIAVEIINDAAIEAYCQANYGKSITVAIGVDLKRLPLSSSACPWAGIAVSGYSRPIDGSGMQKFFLASAVYIQNGNIEPDSEYPSIMVAAGDGEIEELSDLVFAAIERAVSTSPTQTETTYLNEEQTDLGIIDLPEFAATRNWEVAFKP